MAYPNTGSTIESANATGKTSSTLTTQIIIKVDNIAVGALQNLSVTQNRPLERIKEIGTDGVIEIVPNGATEFDLRAERIVFDQLRLPEAFKRGFRFINAQRIPFDIMIIDFSNSAPSLDLNDTSEGIVAMVYKNCWFQSYETPYSTSGYIITESASIWAETAFVSSGETNAGGALGYGVQTDKTGVESSVNLGGRRGSLDAAGLVNSVFNDEG